MSSDWQMGKVNSSCSGNAPDEGMALNASADMDCGAIPSVIAACEAEWSQGRLGDFIELKRGYDLPQAKRSAGDVPLISSSGHSDFHNVAMVKGPGVVTGRYGTIGQVFYVGEDFWPLNTTLYVRDFKGNDPKFVSYFLKTIDFLAYSDKAAVPGVNRNHLHEAIVSMPPLSIQLEIASLLGALDDRIALLRETNATLEAMAKALFKSWFVDFDPVHANAGTRAATLPAELQALFPSTFTDTPQGLVPEGWRMGVVGDVVQQKKGSVNPLQATERLFEHYSLPAFDNNQIPVLEQGEQIKSNKTPLPSNAVLLSKLNPHIPRVWLPFEYGDSAVCSTEFLAYSPINGASKEFIYTLFTSVNFLMNLRQLVTGTSNSHQRVKPDHVLGLELVIPSKGILAEFENAVKPLFARIGQNRQQAQTLATLRDTLLPRLISGQLRLPDAEAALAEAGV